MHLLKASLKFSLLFPLVLFSLGYSLIGILYGRDNNSFLLEVKMIPFSAFCVSFLLLNTNYNNVFVKSILSFEYGERIAGISRDCRPVLSGSAKVWNKQLLLSHGKQKC